MKNVLIVYSSQYGQTKKIAEKMKLWFTEFQVIAKLADVKNISNISLEKYDGIIIGAPVYAASPSKEIKKWIFANKGILSPKITGFFLVCLNAADKRQKARIAEKQILRKFFHQAHWTPKFTAVFAGALNYREYNFLMRFIMKNISRSAGGPTDTSQNYELTDWEKVRTFVRDFSEGNPHHIFDSLELCEGEVIFEGTLPRSV